ncbi:hypothetical protein A3762_16870 [Oleiphilus sp. HI0125]|uniref:DUF4892 domain-containing protein n=1 Tax=Oleiphilus sp. HI0125 TaxID=1822266 RepID=UPI0007C391F7|nr:DUF4892 domain-containing protein [Oleiphilus sp. HI0125]KZZ58713.1 hypothetical protein A3762_06880 [Oleiphilus sp. HI0125]KZZ59384.1 hypothetical protein A3762_16870 [Oleiphilus sp. HI0125]
MQNRLARSSWMNVHVFLVSMLSIALVQVAHAKQFSFEAPGLEFVSKSEQDVALHPFPLSSIKRVSNSLRVDRQTSLEGSRTNYLYRVASFSSRDKVLSYYRNLLSSKGKIEFECAERNCGSSNDWANKVFSIRNLAGRDNNQSYLVGKVDDGVEQGWLSVYVVENVRRENMVYLSFSAAPPADLVADMKRGLLVSDSMLKHFNADALNDYLTKTEGAKVVALAYSRVEGETQVEALGAAEAFAKPLLQDIYAQGLEAKNVEFRAMGRLGQKPLSLDASQWLYLYLVD